VVPRFGPRGPRAGTTRRHGAGDTGRQ
jgi:hypothetical protein